jgi:hypothetical protein
VAELAVVVLADEAHRRDSEEHAVVPPVVADLGAAA